MYGCGQKQFNSKTLLRTRQLVAGAKQIGSTTNFDAPLTASSRVTANCVQSFVIDHHIWAYQNMAEDQTIINLRVHTTK